MYLDTFCSQQSFPVYVYSSDWLIPYFRWSWPSFRCSHLCCLVTWCWGTITTYRAECAQSQIKFGSGAGDNYNLWVQDWMQWFWHLLSLTLGFPSHLQDELCRYLESRSGDWPGWNFAAWLVCPVEQFCDVSKRLHIRNSMGEKALGQYCQKLLIDKQGLPFVLLLTQSTDTPGRKQNGTINVLKIRHVSM